MLVLSGLVLYGKSERSTAQHSISIGKRGSMCEDASVQVLFEAFCASSLVDPLLPMPPLLLHMYLPTYIWAKEDGSEGMGIASHHITFT